MIKGLDRCRTKAEAVAMIQEKYNCDASYAADILRESIPKEAYYQRKLMEHIKTTYPGAFVWKEAAGSYSRQGIPDVSAIIEGRYYGFEVKRPYYGRLSLMQAQTIQEIHKAGGVAGVCTFPEDADRLIQKGSVTR